ncbi:MAG: bifunctional folylpolyglutamate synthase/dihydrofolate synthase [Elusimicrobia bacterium]|nr:bifunctional folylpolyglutamate synthase/dihydrofolate synthase [Elusimicrobiota bacterium]
MSRRPEFRIRPGLAAIQTFLAALGNPQETFPCLHIAGTNGKGSVAVSLSRILEAAGYQVGLYTSPHLWDFRERIQITGEPIPPADLASLTASLDQLDTRLATDLTYFEFATALAFQYFSEAKVDWVVLETGLGGHWDATNVVTHPVVTVVTSIGEDHTQWLGQTLAAIAREKAGIIKSETLVISGVQGREAVVIQQAAESNRAPLLQLGIDFQATSLEVNWDTATQRIVYHGKTARREYTIKLLGPHQVVNAALVLAACEGLARRGLCLAPETIQRGLLAVHWPGRFEVRTIQWDERRQTVIVDGAHNPSAIHALLQTIETSPWGQQANCWVVGMLADKPCERMIAQLARKAQEVVVTTPQVARALPAKQIEQMWRRFAPEAKVRLVNSVKQGIETALDELIQRPEHHDGALIVTGSLYVAGEALAALDLSRV